MSIQCTRFEFKLGTLKIHTIIYKKSAEYENKSITASRKIEQKQQANEIAATAINSEPKSAVRNCAEQMNTQFQVQHDLN